MVVACPGRCWAAVSYRLKRLRPPRLQLGSFEEPHHPTEITMPDLRILRTDCIYSVSKGMACRLVLRRKCSIVHVLRNPLVQAEDQSADVKGSLLGHVQSQDSAVVLSFVPVADRGRVAGLGHPGDLLAIELHDSNSRHYLSYQG